MTNGHLLHQEHPSIDTTGRFAIDDLLRKNGYKIAHRASGQEPTWSRLGEELSQTEALQSLKWAEVEKALKTEGAYFNQFLSKKKKRP